ncbi:MAG: sugar phosphate isomerase/epimerase family protein [Verrucomicrobiota bacterium]
MNLGINTFLFRSPFANEDLGLFRRFKEWGFDTVEPAIEDPSLVDPHRLKDALEESGIACNVICAAFGPGRDLRGSLSDQESTIDYVSQLIDMAKIVGAKVICGPIYSAVGRSESYNAYEKKQHWDLVSKNLKIICSKAEEANIAIAMEPLNRFETDFINTCQQGLEMIDSVGSQALNLHLDTFHMAIEERDSAAAIRKAGDRLAHFHASSSHRGIPGQDQIDWHTVSTALYTISYRGDVVIESFSQDVISIARACCLWRNLGTSEEIARQGLEFLRPLFSSN